MGFCFQTVSQTYWSGDSQIAGQYAMLWHYLACSASMKVTQATWVRVWVGKGCHAPSQCLRTFANQSWRKIASSLTVADGCFTHFFLLERQNPPRVTKSMKNIFCWVLFFLTCFHLDSFTRGSLQSSTDFWWKWSLLGPIVHKGSLNGLMALGNFDWQHSWPPLSNTNKWTSFGRMVLISWEIFRKKEWASALCFQNRSA